MISINNLYKSYNDKKVLNGINLEISSGTIFGLLGPSGAGKTTIIKILTGQLKFDSGNVRVFDKSVSSLCGDDYKNFGIMMDEFGVYERLSCKDNLKIFSKIYNTPSDNVDEILDYVGLSGSKMKCASKLSKGMGARLRLARVFLHNPKILFLDEPTSGLDPLSMKAIHKLILEKKKDGCTIFLTTHNMDEAYNLCDTVALLNDGKIVEVGAPNEICMKYNHKKEIILHLYDGTDVILPHDKSSSNEVYKYLSDDLVESIHSSEPNLETVFLEITGKRLEEVI